MDAEAKYVGTSWRSRFLRAPKIAFEIARRTDFVPLATLASVSLGLKTGNDAFFFLKRSEARPDRSVERFLRSERGIVRVIGMNEWTGSISAKDVRPAIVNPHQFLRGGERRFVVPKNTESLYLFPRTGKPQGDLAAYIRLAEHEGVHKGKLVQSNASVSSWYRQAREIVTARWALPYNSAYDYGALDNAVGAVLNGRFVGVEPLAGIDSDLVGAVLASTFVLVTRLLEGVPTGVEGAFDIGPPAARTIAIPDVRRIPPKKATGIRETLRTMRLADRLPPAPDREANVDPIRHALDLAILEGLGCTKGEASATAGRIYQSYARWRAAVEDVEMEMRSNRRAMSRSGQSRSTSPTDLAARRVWEEMEAGIRVFPGEMLTATESSDVVNVPRNLAMPSQEPLIDAGIVHVDNRKTIDLRHHDRVRYAAMLTMLGKEPPLRIPCDAIKAGRIVEGFLEERARVVEEAKKRATLYVSDAASISIIAAAVEVLWVKRCRMTVE
jgi:hypothetical protein